MVVVVMVLLLLLLMDQVMMMLAIRTTTVRAAPSTTVGAVQTFYLDADLVRVDRRRAGQINETGRTVGTEGRNCGEVHVN